MSITAADVKSAIMSWPCRYRTQSGASFTGCPVSEIPTRLRERGWRNVSDIREHDLRALGCVVVTARYVQGARPKKFCRVVVAQVGCV